MQCHVRFCCFLYYLYGHRRALRLVIRRRRQICIRYSPEELACLEVARECLAGLKQTEATQPIRILSVSTGRGQAAESVARESINLPYRVECDLWYIDQFHQQRSQQHCGLASVQGEDGTSRVVRVEPPSNLSFHCLADAPEVEADLAIVPLTHQGEQELSRDFLQQCFH